MSNHLHSPQHDRQPTYQSIVTDCLPRVVSIFLIFLSGQQAWGCTSSEAEALLNRSRFVHTAYPARVSMSQDARHAAISLYAKKAADDNDCKITALLIAKELNRHCGNLNEVRLCYFDELASSSYRLITVEKSQIDAADAGATAQNVMSSLTVIRRTLAEDQIQIQKEELKQKTESQRASAAAQNVYALIKSRGARIFGETTAVVTSGQTDWTPLPLVAKKGYVVWFDIRSSSARGDDQTSANSDQDSIIDSAQPANAILAKISSEGQIFRIDNLKTAITSPANGQVFIALNHRTNTQSSKKDKAVVRVLLTN